MTSLMNSTCLPCKINKTFFLRKNEPRALKVLDAGIQSPIGEKKRFWFVQEIFDKMKANHLLPSPQGKFGFS